MQSFAQLEKLYREKDAKILFSQAATKIFFATDGEEALAISRMVGTTTVKETVNASGGLSNRESPAPLLDVADIANLERDGEYLALTTVGPMKIKKVPTWDIYKLAMERECLPRPKIMVDDDLEKEHPEKDRPPEWIQKNQPVFEDKTMKPPVTERSAGVTGQHNDKRNGAGKKENNSWERIEENIKRNGKKDKPEVSQKQEYPPKQGKAENTGKDPNISCAAFRIELERRLLKIASKHDPQIEKRRMTAGELLEWMRQENLLPPWEGGLIREFIKTLNKGVHGRMIDGRIVEWIDSVGPGLLKALDMRLAE
jgi:hypothetical protein